MLVLSSYIEPMEWARPTEDAPTPDQETTQALINYWRPFDQRDRRTHARSLPSQLSRTGCGSRGGILHPLPCQPG